MRSRCVADLLCQSRLCALTLSAKLAGAMASAEGNGSPSDADSEPATSAMPQIRQSLGPS